VVAWIYVTVLSFCLLALLVALTRNPVLGLTVLVVEGAVLILLRQREFRSRLVELALRRRQELKSELDSWDEEHDAADSQIVVLRDRPASKRG
jgi:hypothetical protein